jgi:hypothetical protein
MMTRDWRPLLDRSTPFSALGVIVQRQVDAALDALRAQLAAEDDALPPRGIAVIIERARPHVEQQARLAIASAWIHCQLDGAMTH